MTPVAIKVFDGKSFYKQVLLAHGITDVKSVDFTTVPFREDFGLSSIDCVTVHRENGETIDLCVKRLRNQVLLLISDAFKRFSRAAEFYNEVVPILNKTVKQRSNTYTLDMVPKSYFANESILVLESVTKKACAAYFHKRMKRHDLTKAKTVLKTLAKFHAPSYVFLQDPNVRQTFTKKFTCHHEGFEEEAFTATFWEAEFSLCRQILQLYPSEGTDLAVATLESLKGQLMSKICSCLSPENHHVCLVLNHGDFQLYNMMILDDPNAPEKHRTVFINFEACCVCSPCVDIGFYLFNCVKQDVRSHNWKNLLRNYYEELETYVTELGGTLTFTFEQLLEDFKDKCEPGFYNAIFQFLSAEGVQDLIDMDLRNIDQTLFANWAQRNSVQAGKISKAVGKLFLDFERIIDNCQS